MGGDQAGLEELAAVLGGLPPDVLAELQRIVAASPQLLPALGELVSAGSVRDLKQTLVAHPELLTLESLTVVHSLAGAVPPELAPTYELAEQIVERCSAAGIQAGLAKLRADEVPVPHEIDPELRGLLQQAFVLFGDYTNDDDLDALELAIETSQQLLRAPRWQDVPEHMRLDLEGDMAAFRLERYRACGDESDLEEAIDRLDAIVRQARDPSPAVAQNLALGLRRRYDRFGRPEDLERALELSGSPGVEEPGQSVDAGEALLSRYDTTGSASDLDEAIAAFEQAQSSSDLAYALRVRYELTGSLGDLDQAIVSGRRSLDDAPAGVAARASRLNNLGVALHARFEETRDPDDLAAAIDALRGAVDAAPPGSADEAAHRSNLGGALLDSWKLDGELDLLLDGIDSLRRAVELAEPGAPQRPAWLNNLGLGLRSLSELVHDDSGVLDEAVQALEQAVDWSEPDGPGRPSYLVNLGHALLARHALSGEPQDFVVALLAFQDACKLAGERWPGTALAGARALTEIFVEHAQWEQAKLASETAFAAARRLYETHLVRAHKEAWLRRMQGLPPAAAYAVAMLGEPGEAAVLLDQGRALLLSEALDTDRAPLDRLAALGHSELRDRYLAAAGRLETSQEPEARAELKQAIAAIKRVDGYEHFLDAAGAADLAEAARDAPLWYVVATAHGGLALVVGADGTVGDVRLPELRRAELTRRLEGYFGAYEARATDPAAWTTALDDITRWLWDAVMGPLLAAQPDAERATLVPVGTLGFLPLHAAWTDAEGTPTRRRYALDAVTLAYAPNARVATAVRERAEWAAAERLLAIQDPRPVAAAPLPSTREEVARAMSFFGAPASLPGEQATRTAVLHALDEADILHFACHGAMNPDEPLASALIMANDEPLALGDLIDRRLAAVRLAVLSACETAVIGPDLPDEVIALPAGLLQAGAAGVIAPLWSVPDLSTMVLMTRFYELWRRDGLAPLEALRRAQQWVRDATRAELQASFPGVAALSGAQVPSAARQLWARTRPFAAPQFWASFSYMGA